MNETKSICSTLLSQKNNELYFYFNVAHTNFFFKMKTTKKKKQTTRLEVKCYRY